MNTTGTWYPPAALQPSTYDPSAGTGGFLANPPFRPMADLTARTLQARHQVGDRVVLDWLEVSRLATPTRPGGRAVGVTTRQLMERWGCCQSTISRRLAAINAAPPEAGLGRIVRDFGRGSQGRWLVVFSVPLHPRR